MKEKFTKGKWRIKRDLDTYEVYVKENKNGKCFTDYVADVYEREDAHLIAAAPKMYAMLEKFKSFTENMHIQPTGDTIKESVRLHEEAQKLLAEARGE